MPRIAVLGCGYWGRNHARTLAGLGALAAVSDRNPDKMAEFAEEFGAPAVDPDDLFADPAIDGIVLALPPVHHAENALAAIAGGKHVLVEKPIALTVADGQAVVEAAEKAGVVALTGHILRFHPAFEMLESIVAEGTLGDIRYIHAHRTGLGRFHAENDALWDMAPHDISLILALTGEEPSAVRGEGSAILTRMSDFAHLHLEFPSSIRAHVFSSRLNPYRERKLTVVGSEAMAVFDDEEKDWGRKLAIFRHKLWNDEKGWHGEMVAPDYIPVSEDLPLTRECRHFIDCIRGRDTPRTPASEGVTVIKTLSAGTVVHD